MMQEVCGNEPEYSVAICGEFCTHVHTEDASVVNFDVAKEEGSNRVWIAGGLVTCDSGIVSY